jgi:trigger factor
MVPGFEDQLLGKQVGDEVTVEVTFPEAFGNQALAGKAASFAVEIKEIGEPQPLAIDDELAKGQGFDGLEALRSALREGMEREYARVSRLRVKRALLDHLAENCRFEVPGGMVELEFDAIWQQLKREMAAGQGEGDDPADEPDETVRAEYHDIAERRVRLGLILSDVGQANDLRVEQSELNAAVLDQARRYPGQEQKVLDFFKNTPQALEQLRAPLYEDKVVDFILQLASVTDQPMTPEELMKDPDDEADAAAGPPAEAAGADASEPSASREQA